MALCSQLLLTASITLITEYSYMLNSYMLKKVCDILNHRLYLTPSLYLFLVKLLSSRGATSKKKRKINDQARRRRNTHQKSSALSIENTSLTSGRHSFIWQSARSKKWSVVVVVIQSPKAILWRACKIGDKSSYCWACSSQSSGPRRESILKLDVQNLGRPEKNEI